MAINPSSNRVWERWHMEILHCADATVQVLPSKPSGRDHGEAGETVAFSAASTFWHANGGQIVHLTIYVSSLCMYLCVQVQVCACAQSSTCHSPSHFFRPFDKVISPMSCHLLLIVPHDITILSKNRSCLSSKYFLLFCDGLQISRALKIFSLNVSSLEIFSVTFCF